MTREEVKKKIYEKKVKKALRCYRFRPFKNFIFWFAGVLSSVAVVAGTIFVGVKVVPISTYTGGIENEYVSESISSKSIIDALLAFNQYSMADIPGVQKLLMEELEKQNITDFITINEERLKYVKFDYEPGTEQAMLTELLACISINPEFLGEDIASISTFNNYEQIPEEDYAEKFDENGNIKAGVEGEGSLAATPAAYYYDLNDQENQPKGQIVSMSAASGTAQPKYVRAFDEGGKAVDQIAANAVKGKRLFFPALKDVPVMELTQIISETITRIDVGEVATIVLSEVGSESAPDPLVEAVLTSLKGVKMEDFSSMPNVLLSNLKVESLLNIQVLNDFSSMQVFVEWEKVSEDRFPEVDADGNITTVEDEENPLAMVLSSNPKAYYYKQIVNEETTYLPAFEDTGAPKNLDAKAAILTDKELYFAPISKMSVAELLDTVDTTLSRIDVGEVASTLLIPKDTESQLDPMIIKVIEALKGTTLNNISGFASEMLSQFSLADFGGADLIKDLSKFTMFKQWEEVASSDYPEVDKDGNLIKVENEDGDLVLKNNAYLYFYKIEKNGQEKYERAFNNDGTKTQFTGDKLYYANLSEASFEVLVNAFSDSAGRVYISDFVNYQSGSLMEKILKGKTIYELGMIGSEEDPIYLHWVIPFSSATEQTYKLILDALGEEFDQTNLQQKAEAITTLDLVNKQIIFDNISLGQFIDSSTLGLICGAINNYRKSPDYAVDKGSAFVGADINADTICIGDMEDFKPDYIAVSSVMTTLTTDMKKLLIQLTGNDNETQYDVDAKFNTITVGALGDITTDDVNLYIIMGNADDTVKEILKEATQKDFNNIKVKHLTNLTISGVKLSTVLRDLTVDETLKAILSQANKDGKSFENILISDLGNLNLSKVSLATAMGNTAINSTLKAILEEATEKDFAKITIAHLSTLTMGDVKLSTAMTGMTINGTLKTVLSQALSNTPFEEITISNLGSSSFSLDNVYLDSLMPYGTSNATLYNVLLEATGAEANETNAKALKLGALNGRFDLNLVSLSTALGNNETATNNVILSALIKKGVKLGTIGTDIESLTLYEIFGQNCFTTVANEKVEGTHQFKLENGAFVHIDEDEAEEIKNSGGEVYYIHKNDGIWLLVCFEFDEINQTGDDAGRPNEYKISSKTLGDLMKTNEGNNNFMSVALTKATLRQLMDAGMITITNPIYYTKTISDVINLLNGEQQ